MGHRDPPEWSWKPWRGGPGEISGLEAARMFGPEGNLLLSGLPERRNEALVVILLRSEFAPNLAQGCLDGEQTTLRAGLGHRILHPSYPRGAGS